MSHGIRESWIVLRKQLLGEPFVTEDAPADEADAKRQPRFPAIRRIALPEDDGLGERERIGVSNREFRRAASDFGKAPGCASMQLQLRRTARQADHFDVAPQDALRMSGAERFHRSLFRGEPAGEVNSGFAPARAVRDFTVGKNPPGKSIAIAVDRGGDTRNFRRVESEPDDGHASQA